MPNKNSFARKILDFFLNALLSLFAFTLVLALTEVFFQLNTRYHWLPVKVYEPHGESSFPANEIPKDILARAKKKFPKIRFTEKQFNEINDRASEKVFHDVPQGLPFPLSDTDQAPAMSEDLTIHSRVSVGDVNIIDVDYSIDGRHRRRGPYEKLRSPKKKNFLLTGCSYVFGVGVENDQTSSAYLAKELPDYNIYNLGVPSGSITNVVEDTFNPKRLSDLNPNGGIIVYQYWLNHFPRHFTNLNTLRDQYSIMSKYDFSTHDGQLVARPMTEVMSSWSYRLMKLLSRSEFLYYTGWGYDTYSASYQRQFVDLLTYARNYYKENYNLDFYLLIMSPDDIPSDYFIQMLKENDIHYFVYKSFYQYFPMNEYSIPADHHFTPMGNYLWSQLIVDGLKNAGALVPTKPR